MNLWKMGKLRCLTVVLLVASFILTSRAELANPDLVGTAKTKDGAPINATVFISTAAPKFGTSPLCPSCYPDCRKSARASADGKFKIGSLDPKLLFRLLVVAKGYQPKYTGKIDPAGGSIDVVLDPMPANPGNPDQILLGRVVGPDGKPIIGASVDPHGIRRKDGGATWGSLPSVDALAVTDENGEFIITARKPFYRMDLRISARNFANKTFANLASGNDRHELKMTEGASVTGRVLQNGKPVPNVSVGMVSTDRGMENFTGTFEVGTDANGRFTFVNLPPSVEYNLYGIMDTVKKFGTIRPSVISTGKDGDSIDAGDLEILPAHHLAGHIVLEDGGPIPPKIRLMIGIDGAWDQTLVELAQDGAFDTGGIPTGGVHLNVEVPGYHLSARNKSADPHSLRSLDGHVDRDITDLVILLEKGKAPQPNFDTVLPQSEQPRNLPLHGIEGGSGLNEWVVRGRVIDSKTKQPVAKFHVTPGFQSPNNGPWRSWDTMHEADGANGDYSISFSKKRIEPFLKIEASGYLPQISKPLEPGQTTFDFVLEPGAGPAGKVVLANGAPVKNATVVVICEGRQQVNLHSDGDLQVRDGEMSTLTDENGNFSFDAQLEMQSVAAASPEGFAWVSLKSLTTNSTLVLKPWGKIKGIAKNSKGAVAEEHIDLTFSEQPPDTEKRPFLQHHAITDAAGHFEFEHVPPMKLNVCTREAVSQNGYNNVPVQTVTIAPGQTAEVNLTLSDQPKKPHKRPNFVADAPKQITRKPGPEASGIVRLPNGKPAADCEVALQVKDVYFFLAKATFEAYRAQERGLLVTTDTDGKFTLPNVEGAISIVAVNTDGFARIPFTNANSLELKLQPWGRVEGIARVGNHLFANQKVCLTAQNYSPNGLMYSIQAYQAATDDNGHFVITYVPPGEAKVSRMFPHGKNGWSFDSGTAVTVEPGKTSIVQIGGGGRSVLGKAKLIGATGKATVDRCQGSIHTEMPKWPKIKTANEALALMNNAEYKKKMKSYRVYPVIFSSDGALHADDIPPGIYQLSISLMDPDFRFGDGNPENAYIARFEKSITVPKPSNATDETPVNIGSIDVTISKK